MKNQIRKSNKLVISVEKSVCIEFGDIKPKDLVKKSRYPKYTYPRFVIWYILNHKYGMNTSYIGKIYNKHYTTIDYGIKRVIDLNLVRFIPTQHWPYTCW